MSYHLAQHALSGKDGVAHTRSHATMQMSVRSDQDRAWISETRPCISNALRRLTGVMKYCNFGYIPEALEYIIPTMAKTPAAPVEGGRGEIRHPVSRLRSP